MGAGQVKIEVQQFGVGNTVRPGEFFGVQLVLTDTADKPRKAGVVMLLTDDDGDVAQITRPVTLNPRIPIDVWLEGRFPWNASRLPLVEISVREATDDSDSVDAIVDGRQIAAMRIPPATVIDADRALFGVIGTREYGLEQYELRNVAGGILPVSHEVTHIVRDLNPEDLPDDWRALAAYEVLVWTEGDPLGLEGGRPDALREWVKRGGHLVVALPSVGSSWFSDANPIGDLMPLVEVKRIEDASLEPYRNLLTTPDFIERKLPTNTTIHVFSPIPESAATDAVMMFTGPDGCVVSRRNVGTGMVTLIGLDMTSRWLAEGQTVRIDALWNRILGRRITLPTDEQQQNSFTLGLPQTLRPDDHVGGEISKSAAAGVGVLLALIVFGVYWLVAGPLGWAVLKARGLVRHAWLAFAIAIGVFTAIAWAGATWIKPKKVMAYQLSFLDHVYGQPVQRIRTYAGVLLPGYGETTLRVGESGVDPEFKQSIAPWSSPGSDAGSRAFPDARGYPVDVRHPETGTYPTRATIKELQIDFAGGPRWNPLKPAGEGQEPQLVRRGETWQLTGALTHELPAPLQDVTIFLVTGQISEKAAMEARGKGEQGFLPCEAYAWNLPPDWTTSGWPSGGIYPLDSVSLTDKSIDAESVFERWVPMASITGNVFDTGSLDRAEAPISYKRLSFYSMLKPPAINENASQFERTRARIARRAGHSLDLSKWFTQPCLIVVGTVSTRAMPTPLFIEEGEELVSVESEGRTMIRWIYPLGSRPVHFTGDIPLPKKKGDKSSEDGEVSVGKPKG